MCGVCRIQQNLGRGQRYIDSWIAVTSSIPGAQREREREGGSERNPPFRLLLRQHGHSRRNARLRSNPSPTHAESRHDVDRNLHLQTPPIRSRGAGAHGRLDQTRLRVPLITRRRRAARRVGVRPPCPSASSAASTTDLVKTDASTDPAPTTFLIMFDWRRIQDHWDFWQTPNFSPVISCISRCFEPGRPLVRHFRFEPAGMPSDDVVKVMVWDQGRDEGTGQEILEKVVNKNEGANSWVTA